MVSDHLRGGAAWGKRQPAPAAGGDAYGLLFRSEGFPNDGEEALRLLAKSVQWRADSSEARLQPSFAMWPVGKGDKGVLVARLLDFGHDSFGRVRTMRIEAAWFDVSEPRDALKIATRYLAPSGWPAEPWSGPENILLASDVPANDVASRVVSQFIHTHQRVPRFLVPGHGSYYLAEGVVEGFDEIHGPEGVTTLCGVRRGDPRESGLSLPRQATTDGDRARPPRRRRMFLPLLIATMAAAIGGLAAGIRRERARADAIRAAVEEVEETAERRQRELTGLAARLKSAENAIRARESRLKGMGAELDELRAEEKAFEDYWSVIKEYDIKSAAHLRARLDRLDQDQRRAPTDAESLDGQ